MMYLHNQEGHERVKWLTHYSSNHHILLVGDGDFSFSLCLARPFAPAFKILATSLDSYDEVTKKYKEAKSNLMKLDCLGARILHGVDATKMMSRPDLMNRRFDRIIFNFPHAGFRGKEDDECVIQMHRTLIHGFFWNAKSLLLPDGEIHINHKTTPPFSHWNLEELARANSLFQIERVKFKCEDYPTYKQKRGDSARCDEPFPFGESSTFKFGLITEQFHHFDLGQSQTSHIAMHDYNNYHLHHQRSSSHELLTYAQQGHILQRPLNPTSELNRINHYAASPPIATMPPDRSLIQGTHFYHTGFLAPSEHGFGVSREVSKIMHRKRRSDQDDHLAPPFSLKRSCHIDSRLDERSFGLDRTWNQDTHFSPEMNGRTWNDNTGVHQMNDHLSRLMFYGDSNRTKNLRLVRKYGNEQSLF